jgi:tRNA A-37 threonylcarbamoyl transferase component Bud32
MNDNDETALIGLGRAGRVMRIGNIAVKTANIWTVPKDASETTIIGWEQMVELNKESLKHEGLVYCHLGHVQGVMKPCQITDTEIQMPYLRHGSLCGYLRAHSDSVDSIRRLRWLQEAAHIIRRVHERRVLVADIATRNFLLDDNLSLQMCDFTESVIVSNDEDMANFVSEDCLSVKFDIARFGSMMYEVTSGSRYEFYVIPEIEADLDDDPESKTFKAWPTAEKLPNTNNVFLGDIIRRCWAGDGFLTMQEVCHALDNADQKPAALKASGDAENANLNWRHLLRLASPVATTIIFAFVIVPRLRFPWRAISSVLRSTRH